MMMLCLRLPSSLLILVLALVPSSCEAFQLYVPLSPSKTSAALYASVAEDLRLETIRGVFSKLERVHQAEATGAFFQKLDKTVEVKPSSIQGAGRGLFAKKNIKAGSIVGFYPVHGLGFEGEESSTCLGSNEANEALFNGERGMYGEHGSNYVQFLIGSRPLLSYDVKDLFKDDALFVNVNPNQADDVGWASHYINDGATVGTPGDESSILEYYTASRSRKNCVQVPFGPCPILATVTTRKVKKGEELLMTYGGSYWFEVLLPGVELEATVAIQEEAKETARDIYNFMQSVLVTHEKEAVMLQTCFSSEE